MSYELANAGGSDAIQIAQHIEHIKGLGATLVKSGLLPQSVRTPEAAVAIILKGRELGIPPMQALSHIHVISGKPTLSAELMLAMAMKAGHEVWVSETSDKQCSIHGKRAGSDREQSLTFTMGEAQQAGVTSNPTWKKYPAAMLRARAISAFLRMFAPDVLMGASYTPEELGANVDGDGEILDAQFTQAVERDYDPPAHTLAEPPQEAEYTGAETVGDVIGPENGRKAEERLKKYGVRSPLAFAKKVLKQPELTSLEFITKDEVGTLFEAAKRQSEKAKEAA